MSHMIKMITSTLILLGILSFASRLGLRLQVSFERVVTLTQIVGVA